MGDWALPWRICRKVKRKSNNSVWWEDANLIAFKVKNKLQNSLNNMLGGFLEPACEVVHLHNVYHLLLKTDIYKEKQTISIASKRQFLDYSFCLLKIMARD